MISSNTLYEVHDQFRQTDDSGWYLQGGCYDYAYGLGSALEELGIDVNYWELGSNGEPQVHVFIEALGYFIDFNTMSKDIAHIERDADIYADTEISNRPIKKEDISTSTDMTIGFLELIDSII